MPKPMNLHIVVEEIAFGRIFRLLDGTPGVVRINLQSEEAPKQARKPSNPDKKPQGVRVLMALNASEDPLSLVEIAEALGTNCNNATKPVSIHLRAKRIQRVRRGVYKITAAGIKYLTADKE